MANCFTRKALAIAAVGGGALLGITLPASPHPCPDINGDKVVNVADLLAVINAWGPCPPAPEACPANVGLNSGENDVVNVTDLIYVINHWGECPPEP